MQGHGFHGFCSRGRPEDTRPEDERAEDVFSLPMLGAALKLGSWRGPLAVLPRWARTGSPLDGVGGGSAASDEPWACCSGSSSDTGTTEEKDLGGERLAPTRRAIMPPARAMVVLTLLDIELLVGPDAVDISEELFMELTTRVREEPLDVAFISWRGGVLEA